MAASSSSVRLVQVCVLDHSAEEYEQPHLHIMLHFTDSTSTPWECIYHTNLMAFRQALTRVQPGRRVRVHLHDDPEDAMAPPPPVGMSDELIDALPRVVLQQHSKERMHSDGTDTCPFCLDEFEHGDEVLLFPCPGTHKAHAACSATWLASATTCPTCRFALPNELPTARTLDSLLEPAHAEATRIREGMPPPCLPVDEEAPELADLSLLFHSGRPSARKRPSA